MADEVNRGTSRATAVRGSRAGDAQVKEKARIIAGRLSSRFTTEVVKKARAKGLKHKDLARAMGISAPALTKDLRSRNLTFETAARMALALGGELAIIHDGNTISAEIVPEIGEVEDAMSDESTTSEMSKAQQPAHGTA